MTVGDLDSAALEDARMAAYMRQHFGVKLMVGAPPVVTPTPDPAVSSEPEPQAVEDAAFQRYMETHFPNG